MRVVIDTNILFSAILNTNSQIAKVILHSRQKINFYSTPAIFYELQEHKEKLKRLGKYSDVAFAEALNLFFSRIRLIDVELIPLKHFIKAEGLTSDVDIDDTEFIALTEHIRGKFWSGDKELKAGLKNKMWNKFITTPELYKFIQPRRKPRA
jgi:predicted nucleic acid-binding protein